MMHMKSTNLTHPWFAKTPNTDNTATFYSADQVNKSDT